MSVKERREREEKARLAAILEAAESVFADQGYFHARMDDIAERAELAKGTIYYYFKSKDEIYLHLLERETAKVQEEIVKRITDDSTLLEALAAVLEFYLDHFESNRSFLKMFLPCMCGLVKFEDEAALRKSTRSYERHGEFVRDVLKAKIARTGAPVDGDMLVRFLKTLQIGLGLTLLEGKRTEARAAVRFFLDLMKRTMEAT